MATTLAILTRNVKSRLEPESSAPTFNSIHSDQWARWATVLAQEVVAVFYEKDKKHIQVLLTLNKSLAVSSGVASLTGVTDFAWVENFKVTSSKYKVELLDDRSFAWWDSANFVSTPTANRPIGLVTADKILVKPTTDTGGSAITAGYVDYFKKHPDIDSSNGTLFSAIADKVLEDLMFKRALEAIEDLVVE